MDEFSRKKDPAELLSEIYAVPMTQKDYAFIRNAGTKLNKNTTAMIRKVVQMHLIPELERMLSEKQEQTA
jgi:hypothetical protein